MEKANKIQKNGWIRFLMFVGGVLMAILGILLFIRPIAGTGALIWLAFAGLFINGIVLIVKFCQSPKGQKDGINLGFGILWILISVLVLVYACGNPFAATVNMEFVFAIMVGLSLLFSGICNLCTCNRQASLGWAIAGGIIEILCGLAVLSQPILGLLTFAIVFGIYLVATGIMFVVNAFTK